MTPTTFFLSFCLVRSALGFAKNLHEFHEAGVSTDKPQYMAGMVGGVIMFCFASWALLFFLSYPHG